MKKVSPPASASGSASASAPGSAPGSGAQQRPRALALHKADHDPRAAALVALSRVLFEGTDSQAAVDDALKPSSLVPTDKRLCTELVYGVLRYYIRLDWFTCRFLSKPEKLPQEMRLTLILALYEMNFLRIPAHASVGWAVTHVRNRFGQGLGKVANGVLRTIQRSLVDFYKPGVYARSFETIDEGMACFYAMPLWIVNLWRQSYGLEEATRLLQSSLDPAPSGLRINMAAEGWETARQELLEVEASATRRGGKGGKGGKTAVPALDLTRMAASAAKNQPAAESEEATTPDVPADQTPLDIVNDQPTPAAPSAPADSPATVQVLPIGPCALAFPGTLPWQARVMVKEGKATRQSAASYATLDTFAPETWPQPLWDCCAGRGGKTLALLERGVPVALATDTSAARLSALPKEYERLTLTTPPCPAVRIISATATQDELTNASSLTATTPDTLEALETAAAPLPENFGTILIDAPCSGLGTLTRHPEIRLRRTEQDIERLIATQREILAAAWAKLNPGGYIVYLTCTLNPAENEAQIAHFLETHPNSSLLKEYQTPTDSPLREFFYGALVRKDN